MTTTQLVVNVIGILLGSGVVGGIVSALMTRKKTSAEVIKVKAEASEVLTNQALLLLTPLQRQADTLQEKLERAEEKIADLTSALDESHAREREHLREIDRLKDELSRRRARRDQERGSA